MNDKQIVSKMNEYLHLATGALSDWLQSYLPRATPNWWDECVIEKLSYNQREIAQSKGFTNLSDFDLAALLRIADKNWYTMRSFAYLPTSERECVRDMQGVRNNWAHCGGILPGKDSIIRDLEILQQFLSQLSVSKDTLAELKQFKASIEQGAFVDAQIKPEVPTLPIHPTTSTHHDQITERSMVYLIGNPAAKGMVFSIEDLGEIKKYEVFIDGSIRTFYSGQIALVDNTTKYNWIDIDTFQSYLSAYQINNPSAGNLYSLNSARIDFVPYQFRPALKLIKADEPRILIADSVGVGKTIEAGLIIKELEARSELENIMIICPKPLVTERKWELEMKRFDEDFIPLKGQELRQIISDTDRDGEWPARYSKTIVPYSILDSRVYDGEDGKYFGLSDLDPAPHFDLVIVDEAHHIRNGSMDKEKAFAYKCVKYFCDHADAVVMLTATPLQTSDDDLFTLLNLLRPDVILDKETFNMMSRPNAHISSCSRIVRAAKEGWQQQALEVLKSVTATQWGENVISKNPLYTDILKTLQKEDISREERVQLITDIESLHSFNTMLNRTRRKDIQDFCVRRAHTLEIAFTPEQKKLHDELLAFERAALSKLHDVRSVPFMMSTIRRQAASCIFGLAPYIKDIIERRFDQLADDPEIDLDKYDLYSDASTSLAGMAKRILDMAADLPEEDPKFDSVMSVIRQKQEQQNNKIILFSTFRHTLAYVKSKLFAEGLRVAQIDGSVKDDIRLGYRQRFELEKSNPDALDILLFTEVGSEGLDYQFCDMMINYDLPWNPMRIEQRIGRIDRRGQVSEVVNIYNVITSETVDADIYHRCLNRIGIFERSIGECEEILQEIGAQVEQIVVNSNLTDEERRTKLEQMADNEIRKAQELSRLEDEEKELFGFDLSGYTMSKEIQDAESPWLTPRSLQALVERYLNARLGNGVYIMGEPTIKTLRLSATARQTMRDDLNSLPNSRSAIKRRWEVYLKGKEPLHTITFDAEAAKTDRNAFLITTVHPLVKQAAQYFSTTDLSYINIQHTSDSLPEGTHPFAIYAWNYVGINPHFNLVPICADNSISDELIDILNSSKTVPFAGTLSKDMWSSIESKHIKLWLTAKQLHIENAQITANYKLESIENNFRNRQRLLEQKIRDAYDVLGNLKRMYQSELDSATEKYEARCNEIRTQAAQADIHITLIAKGLIHIERK